MSTLAQAITACRILAGDGTMDNLRRNENLRNLELGNVIDGTNKTFFVNVTPIAAGGLLTVRADNTIVPSNQIVVTEPEGMFVLTNAPASNLFATYYYYLFDDTVWTEIVKSALQRLNLSSGDPNTDIPSVVEGLMAALKIYAHAFFCNRLAMQTGLWYNKRLQESTDDRDNIANKFEKMATGLFKQGDVARDAFYQDRNLVPAFAIVQMQGDRYTPSH